MNGKLVVFDHPLMTHKLSIIRNEKTNTKDFRETVSEIANLMAYEATRNVPMKEVEVKTPIAVAKSSMIDGDIVIVERTESAKNGDMVVAMNDNNEVTLKTFYKEKDHFRLQPENDYMEPIILDSVTILGKAIGLYRKF